MSSKTLTELAESLLAKAKELESHESTGRFPANGRHALTNLTAEGAECRFDLLDNLQELQRTVLGPHEYFVELAFSSNTLLGLQSLYRYNLPVLVPEEGTISFTELAKAAGQDENIIRRLLRFVMLHGVFSEPIEGYVKHTEMSLFLHKTPDVLGMLGFFDSQAIPALRTLDALEKWSGSHEPTHSGYNLAYQTSESKFVHMAKNPEIVKAASGTFRSTRRAQGPGFETRSSLLSEIDQPNSVFVDIGGNRGYISRSLAELTTHLRFIVQDLPGTLKDAEKDIPETLRGRIEFMAHSFFELQPVKNADVYFFRLIMHDWPDKSCVQILRNLVPALKNGARVVFVEHILPERGSNSCRQKITRNTDLVMLANFNSRERTEKEWQALFAEADTRFGNFKTESWPGTFSLIQVTWEG
ncbi:uncharacterized protein K452DRAFT_255218 [Aplosporella prunicola CBS 121167]|uniref:O-methyltransferase C-terminal domain-containing protein n=1 Tax=Aplosporella prunicola CBS 121167 TaxID=1176127 RepID=A0A6A6B5H6_9PEZI|nr:uncharacterized protein K452DRAFT_255218 [Aplosporella prunicola CBS 121167]KAF2139106.1 hypothetical protein K452DRAFT_255218 [Aplosporella prunicola CBS 121167]